MFAYFHLCYSSFSLNNTQESEFNACWNSVYRRIFNFQKWESVRGLIHGLGRLNFTCIRYLMCLKFAKQCLSNANTVLKELMYVHIFTSCEFNTLCELFDFTKLALLNKLLHGYVYDLKLYVNNYFQNNLRLNT